jgi:uronate dehydrogenase
MRPDGHYGLSKAFGENVARFYFDRYGIESVCLRIGSSFPEPKDRRMLATWLSYDDLERLVVASLTAPVVGCSIVYGVSDNTTTGGTTPRRRTSAFARRTARSVSRRAEARQPVLDRSDPAVLFQGGGFVTQGPSTDHDRRLHEARFHRALPRCSPAPPSPRTRPNSARPTSIPTAIRPSRRSSTWARC